jgi:hypothetical protein
MHSSSTNSYITEDKIRHDEDNKNIWLPKKQDGRINTKEENEINRQSCLLLTSGDE